MNIQHTHPEILRVIDVEYVKDYIMDLEFNDGKRKRIDFYPLLTGQMFEPLKEHDKFVQFALTHLTLEWYNGADFAPEFLYNIS